MANRKTMGDAREKTRLPMRSCPGKIQVPTEEEKQALEELRRIKAIVREKKAQLRQLRASGEVEKSSRIQQVESQLEELKGQWNVWESRRENAAKKRMILLGHEEPEANS